MQRARIRLIVLFLSLALFAPAFADEGMWLFNMPPANLLKARYNFDITPEWLQHVQLASVRFGGASGSFVSPDGLVLTNHHVGQGAIQNLSTKERDLMKTGFYARTRAEELKAPGMELMVLQEIEDITAKVLAAERPEMTAVQAAEARDKVISALEKESTEKTGFRSTTVNLYSGSMYHLYKYKVYADVRLVFAPEYLIAFFGGDPDNFTYPRFDLDISLFRVYENDKPVRSEHYLKWNAAGLKENELVFASGHPGSTGRLLTVAQMEFLRDVSYPFAIANYERRRALLQQYGQRGPEYARQAQGPLFGIENSLKANAGYQAGLLDKALMAKKAKDEQEFRASIGKDPAMDKEFGKAWDELAAAEKAFAGFFKAYRYFEGGTGFATSYFNTARTLVRLAAEKGKKVPITTSFRGLFEKAEKAGNKDPYELPPSFLKGKARLKLDTPLNFISTCDSIGGNSGSPVINRKAEFSGVLFDGNIQSLPARFVYSDEQSRSVMVHSQGILEALVKIYDARPLVDELLGKK